MAAQPSNDVLRPATVTLVRGGSGSGKTQRLVDGVTQELLAGADPGEVAVVCATPLAAQAFAERLTRSGVPGAPDVTVTWALRQALDLLSDPEAVHFTGREPRLLTAAEQSFLMEDVKMSGVQPRRLREMLKFFYRSWSELADDDPAWIIPGEEQDVHTLLKDDLRFLHAMLEPETANLAVRYLRTHPRACAEHGRTHLFVDDFQCLSRASQVMVRLLARTSLTVAANPHACVRACDSYPYVAGVDELLRDRPRTARTTVEDLGKKPSSGRSCDPGANPGERPGVPGRAGQTARDVVAAATPADEFELVAAIVAQAVEQGALLSSIAVAVPNDVWARNMGIALAQKGIRSQTVPERQPVGGDVRDERRCRAARILCALELAANERDPLAWRSWCGFGDHLTRCGTFATLRAIAEQRGLELVDALDAFESDLGADLDNAPAEAAAVLQARARGSEIVHRVQGLEGRPLLEALAAEVGALEKGGSEKGACKESAPSPVPPALLDLCLDESGPLDAAAMARRARERLVFPEARERDAVAVVPYDATVGLSPNLLVVCGFVNGFIPCHDYFDGTVTPLDRRRQIHEADLHRIANLEGKATERLVVTYFSEIDLQGAEELRVKIDRIRLKNGLRTCSVSPSELLEELVGR